MKRAVVYARVSTDRQAEDGLSIDSQIDACQRKAAELGAVVVHVFKDEGISGTTRARPGFRNAIQRCEAGDVHYLLCWSSSRFARDQHDAITFKRELVASGTKLVYAQSTIDLDSMEGWMLDSFQQVVDESYSRQVSADTKRSMIKAAAEGFFMGGRVPYGYQAVQADDGKRRRLAPLDNEATVIRMIFRHALEGKGAYIIALQLNQLGLKMRGKNWSKNTVLHMLKSEVYMGNVIYNRFHRKGRGQRPPEAWVRVQAHEPLVSQADFEQVQSGLDERTPVNARTPGNVQHVFSGMMRCSLCSASLQMTNGTGRGGKLYHYYSCRGSKQGRPCGLKNIPADAFDKWLLNELLDKVLNVDVIQGVLDHLDEAATRWVKDRAARRTALVLELRNAEHKRDKLFELMESLGRDTPDLRGTIDRVNKLADQVKRLELALMNIEDEPDPVVGTLRVTAQEAADIMRRTVTGNSDVLSVRAFVATIVESIEVADHQVVVAYKPECLVSDGQPVRSKHKWLPVPGTLRTATLMLQRPRFPLRLAA